MKSRKSTGNFPLRLSILESVCRLQVTGDLSFWFHSQAWHIDWLTYQKSKTSAEVRWLPLGPVWEWVWGDSFLPTPATTPLRSETQMFHLCESCHSGRQQCLTLLCLCPLQPPSPHPSTPPQPPPTETGVMWQEVDCINYHVVQS